MSGGVRLTVTDISERYGGGAGQFGGGQQKKQDKEEKNFLFSQFDTNFPEPQNIGDPVFVVFDELEDQSLTKLIKESIVNPIAQLVMSFTDSFNKDGKNKVSE